MPSFGTPLGARGFSWVISGFGQVFIVICVKSFVSLLCLLYLGQTPKHPTACEKKPLVPRQRHLTLLSSLLLCRLPRGW